MVFHNDTFRKYRHGIEFTDYDVIDDTCANLHLISRDLDIGDEVKRPDIRTSSTCRHMLSRCKCAAEGWDDSIQVDNL